MHKIKQFKFIIALSASLLTSCSFLPVSKEAAQDAYKILYEERFHLDEVPTLEDKKLYDYLNRLTSRITDNYKIAKPFIVVADTFEAQGMMSYDKNAIFISRGMLYAIKSEAELVALLGHEVGHTYLKHHLREHKSLDPVKDIIESVADIDFSDVVLDELEELNQSQFQKALEVEADRFGAEAAKSLGYNPFEFVNLLERLSAQADSNILEKLSQLKGSHLTLAQRAKNLRDELIKKKIESKGRLNSDEYLQNVRHITEVKDSKKAILAREKLESLTKTLESRYARKDNLTFEEFLNLMKEFRAIAQELNLLSQLRSRGSHDLFMMELVRVPKAWWQLENNDRERLQQSLSLLGRMGVGVIPVIGDAIDLYEVLTGRDFYSGQELTYGERVASALGLIASSGQQWRALNDALIGLPKSSISAIDPKKVSEAARVAREAIEEAPLFKKTTQDANQTAKEVANKFRLIKDKENYEVMTKLAKEMEGKNIPDTWGSLPTKERYSKGEYQGFDFPNPDNPKIRLRVMPGNKNAKHINSREPYVQQTIGRMSVDKNGKLVKPDTDAAHIPLKDYHFTEFWKKYVKD